MRNSSTASFKKKFSGIHTIYRFALKIKNLASHVRSPFLSFAPAGHYLSPLPQLKDVLTAAGPDPGAVYDLPGIELRAEEQLNWLEQCAPLFAEFPYTQVNGAALRYHFPNPYFGIGDAAILYAFMRRLQPAKIIEIGSGYSSAVMLDTADLFLDHPVEFTFVEPNPGRLYELLNVQDRQRHHIIPQPVQEVSLDLFRSLVAGDFLFVDSSHIVKPGSDVGHILFNILPQLAQGVFVHFHDIVWPFEYPLYWYQQGMACNEAPFLRAFLQYNSQFEIIFYNSFMAVYNDSRMEAVLPQLTVDANSSLWLKRV